MIPAASIKIVNVGTGIETEAETNESGYYTLLSLVPGTYRLEIVADGFRRFVRSGLELETGQLLRVDAELEVGALTEVVTVTSATPAINLERGAIKGDVIVFEEIQDLPLPGRDFTNLAFLVPGVMPRGPGRVPSPRSTALAEIKLTSTWTASATGIPWAGARRCVRRWTRSRSFAS